MKTVFICIACFAALIITYVYLDHNLDRFMDIEDNIYTQARNQIQGVKP